MTDTDVPLLGDPRLARVAVPIDSPAWIDEFGVLHVGRQWVALPMIEWRILGALLDRFGATVRRTALIEAAWPGQTRKEAALNVRIATTRRRIEPLGLRISNVRARGYVLDSVDPTSGIPGAGTNR